METAVYQSYFERIDREACQNTILHSRLESLLYRRDILFGDITAFHLVDKLQRTFEAFVYRTYFYDNICEFTATTGLFLVHLTCLNLFGNSLFVCNLRLTLIALYLKFAF